MKSTGVAAIVCAAGKGTRFGASGIVPAKQFIELNGQPLYIWCVRAFMGHSRIDHVVVVTLEDLIGAVTDELAAYAPGKPVSVIAGGATRQESVYKGLQFLQANRAPSFALVHDAARPLVSGDLIDRCIDAATEHGAFTVGLPCTDTIKSVEGGKISGTIDRTNLVTVQTPQGGRFDWLCQAHSKAREQGLSVTDDAALLEAAGQQVVIVEGSRFNIKVTTHEDLELCRAIVRGLGD